MNERDADLLHHSYKRCLKRSGFLERFYEIFVASSEEVAAKFAHTDFKKQIRVLKLSLYMLMTSVATPLPELARIAEVHSKRQLDIPPKLYDLWLDCLLQAVREFDPKWNEEVDAAWRRVLTTGIQFMKSKYV